MSGLRGRLAPGDKVVRVTRIGNGVDKRTPCTVRTDRARRERQNTRRRIERVCAALAKHLARRAAR